MQKDYIGSGDKIASNCQVITLVLYMARDRGACDYCQRHGMWVNTCQGCGEKFHTTRRHAKTCSARCRQKVSRAKV